MDPVTNKILQGTPFVGMGGTQERNALIGVIRNLISEDKYTVDYILNYAQSVGYQRQMAEDVFKELTGLSPKLIVNNNEYYNMPAYVPNMCIAWGTSKSNKEKAFYIVPFEYGYAVMEKDEVNAPIPTVISATIPEAFDELKKVAKGIQTLDKIITKKLLEAEDVQTDAHTVHQVNLPYAASPLQVLKKNFKDKVLSVSEFERQASKLLEADEITVDEAEDLMNWKQDLIDEDESYANDVLENNEKWNEVQATIEFEDVYNELKYLAHHDDDTFNKDKVKSIFEANKDMFQEVDLIEATNRLYQLLLGFSKEEVLGHSDFNGNNKKASLEKKALYIPEDDPIIDAVIKDGWPEPMVLATYSFLLKRTGEEKKINDELITKVTQFVNDFAGHKSEETKYSTETLEELAQQLGFKKQASKKVTSANSNLNDSIKEWYIKTYKTDECGDDINPNTTFMEVLSDAENAYDLIGVTDSVVRERVFDELSKRTNIPYEKICNMWMGKQASKKKASKKVTAEDMTLDDITEEDNKDQVQEEIEKVDETPAEDIFSETTPEQYFEDALAEDKVDTINEVVSKCIDKFSEKFKDFDKYEVKVLSYNTKVLGDYEPTEDELVEDKELNANAILQIIMSITNKADEVNMKKVLAVFSITNGELHWTGTVRGENDQVVAFTEEGLDALFEVEEPSEEELEDII